MSHGIFSKKTLKIRKSLLFWVNFQENSTLCGIISSHEMLFSKMKNEKFFEVYFCLLIYSHRSIYCSSTQKTLQTKATNWARSLYLQKVAFSISSVQLIKDCEKKWSGTDFPRRKQLSDSKELSEWVGKKTSMFQSRFFTETVIYSARKLYFFSFIFFFFFFFPFNSLPGVSSLQNFYEGPIRKNELRLRYLIISEWRKLRS